MPHRAHTGLGPDHRPCRPEPTSSKPLAPDQWLESLRAIPHPLPVSLNNCCINIVHWLGSASSNARPQSSHSMPCPLGPATSLSPWTEAPCCPRLPSLLSAWPPSDTCHSLPLLCFLMPHLQSRTLNPTAPVLAPIASLPGGPTGGKDTTMDLPWPFSRVCLGNFLLWAPQPGAGPETIPLPGVCLSLSHITTGLSQTLPCNAPKVPSLGSPHLHHPGHTAHQLLLHSPRGAHGTWSQGTPPVFPRPQPQLWP